MDSQFSLSAHLIKLLGQRPNDSKCDSVGSPVVSFPEAPLEHSNIKRLFKFAISVRPE